MRCAAMRRCSRATTRSRRSGRSAPRSSVSGRKRRGRYLNTRPARRAPRRRTASCWRAIAGARSDDGDADQERRGLGRAGHNPRRDPMMATQTTSDATWSEEGTTPDQIEAALRELLVERHNENANFVPARVLNMIAFVDQEWSGEIANRLRGVGRYHASRTLVLSYEPRRGRLEARVTIASEGHPGPGELALLRETVIVEIGDRHLDDLFTIVDPLVVTDLP